MYLEVAYGFSIGTKNGELIVYFSMVGLPNVHSVHVHSRPHHRGGPTTMANMKNCY